MRICISAPLSLNYLWYGMVSFFRCTHYLCTDIVVHVVHFYSAMNAMVELTMYLYIQPSASFWFGNIVEPPRCEPF